jgi:hypothetical protein
MIKCLIPGLTLVLCALPFAGVRCEERSLPAASSPVGQPLDIPLSDELKSHNAGLVIYQRDTASWCEQAALAGVYFDTTGKGLITIPDSFVVGALANQAIYLDHDPYPRYVPLRDRMLNYLTFGWWKTHFEVFDLQHSREWTRTVKALRASGYETFEIKETILTPGCVIAVPQTYSGSSEQVDAQLDYALDDTIASYSNQETADFAVLDEQQALNQQLKSQTAAEAPIADGLQGQLAAEYTKYNDLWTQVRALHLKLGDYAFTPGALLELTKKPDYSHDRDYLVSAIKDNLQAMPLTINWDSKQVSDPYLQPELIDAIEHFQSEHSAELAALGVPRLVVVSAARTPINQLAQQSDNPVAAGVFTTGHAMGVAFDFSMAGTPVDVKPYVGNQATPDDFDKLHTAGLPPGSKPERVTLFSQYQQNPVAYRQSYTDKLARWQKLAALMAANDLPLSAGLVDPNHAFLGLYKGTSGAAKSYQNGVRIKMLRAYLNAMKAERAASASRLKDAKTESQSLIAAKFNLDQRISQLQKELDDLRQREADLAAEKGRLEGQLRDREQNSDRGPNARSGGDSYRPSRDDPGNGGGGGPDRSDSHHDAGPSGDKGVRSAPEREAPPEHQVSDHGIG